jgi:hypothetical protein
MITIADKIRTDFDEEVNHAIVIEYSDGRRHHAPPHSDKLHPGTSFYVLSYGTPRTFQLLDIKQVGVTKKGNPQMGAGAVAWEMALPSNSLLAVSGDANSTLLHAVPRDRGWTGDTRFSLIFRTIHEEAQQ